MIQDRETSGIKCGCRCRHLPLRLLNAGSYSNADLGRIPTPNASTLDAATANLCVRTLCSNAFLVCLTENVRCLGFAPVRVVDQRDFQGDSFRENCGRFSFAINYPFLVRASRLLCPPVLHSGSATGYGSGYEGWTGEGGSAINFLPC